jgi:membrane-bound serine protease (ClpP class)
MAGQAQIVFRWLLALLGSTVVVLGVLLSDAAVGASRRAVVIGLDGSIGPATASYVVRSLRESQQEDVAVVVLRLDTPGGLDSAMRAIIRAMLASPVPVLAYVAPSGARAASAGTYILYAAALAAMAPGTNLGAATPISLLGPPPNDRAKTNHDAPGQTPDTLLTKVTNDAAAYIRSLAVLHGRNADWAEKAVREAVSLPYDAALDQHVIDLVANDIPDLLTQANGRTVLVQGKPMRLATLTLEIVEIGPSWRDQLLALLSDPSIVYVLLLVGMFGIAFELSHPGVFAPGVIGVICLLVGGYAINLLSINYAGLALTLLGLGLMAAEAFVPSFGAFVLGGAAAFAIGSLMMFETSGVALPLSVIAGATLICATLFAGVLTLLLRARRNLVVRGGATLNGLTGRVVAWHATEGEVMVQGIRWRARADRTLEPGQAVLVVGRHGLTLLVEAT